jgi:CheY-like chemotaxis protein
MRILYVEDNLDEIELVGAEMKKNASQHSLDVVHTQQEAMNRLTTTHQNYDLVLTDMRLSDGDGLAVLSHIRGSSLPLAVVLITGQGDEGAAVTVMKAGADDYVAKRGTYWKRLPEVLENALNHFRCHIRISGSLRVLYVEDESSDILIGPEKYRTAGKRGSIPVPGGAGSGYHLHCMSGCSRDYPVYQPPD